MVTNHNIYGEMLLTPSSNALYIKTILEPELIDPLNQILLAPSSNNFGGSVEIKHGRNSTSHLQISGYFYDLGYYLADYLNDLVDLGFEVHGLFEVTSGNHKNTHYLLNGLGNNVETVLSSDIGKNSFLELFRKSIPESKHSALSGYVELKKGHALDKYSSKLPRIESNNQFDSLSFETIEGWLITSESDFESVIEMIQENKESIIFCSIASLEGRAFFEYKYECSQQIGSNYFPARSIYNYLDVDLYRSACSSTFKSNLERG